MSETKNKLKQSEKTEEKNEFEDKYLRALADYQNLLKQTTQAQADFIKYANEGLLLELLPIFEHLKMSVELSAEGGQWLEGVRHVVKQLEKVLTEAGIERIEGLGRVFDHNTMEAVEVVETDESDKDQLVAKELKSGYLLNGKVIMPAKVAVYKLNLK